MSRPAQALLSEFTSHLAYVDFTRRRCEELLARDAMVRRDVEFVYGGLILDALGTFERFLEDLFVGLVCGHITHPSNRVRSKVTFQSPVVCRNVLQGNRPYVEWLPYDHTFKRSGVYLREGLPFSALPSPLRQQLDRVSITRNAVAHRSRFAVKKFQEQVLSGLALLPRERSPTGYLRGLFAINPRQTRYEVCIGLLVDVARKLATDQP